MNDPISTPSAEPLVSFCIPTFNRDRYLGSLLESMTTQLEPFPFTFEVVVADNASPDATGDVASSFAERLPIRYFRHEENIGGFPNWQFVMSQARGRYIVYVSDDDCILGEAVAQTIARMESDPQIVVTYAPWMLYDLVAQQPQGQFYEVPHDLVIERGAHRELLDHVLRHHIFPEVQIVRRDALQRVMPRINTHAFFAFMHAADYVSIGRVLIQQQPYYVAITRYFADETRTQLGTEEVEYAWDRYRGGLEYLLARAGHAVRAEEHPGFALRIQQMIALRMSVAIRLRHLQQRDPVDTWTIAMRLRGMGYEALCPVPLATLSAQAAMHFVMRDALLHQGIRRMLVVGDSSAAVQQHLRGCAPVPIEFSGRLPDLQTLTDTLIVVRDDLPDAAAVAQCAQRNVRMVREADVLGRF